MPDSEDLTLYQPPKALEVLGFTARDNVPRHCFMRVSVLHFCGVHVQIGAQSDSSCISTLGDPFFQICAVHDIATHTCNWICWPPNTQPAAAPSPDRHACILTCRLITSP